MDPVDPQAKEKRRSIKHLDKKPQTRRVMDELSKGSAAMAQKVPQSLAQRPFISGVYVFAMNLVAC